MNTLEQRLKIEQEYRSHIQMELPTPNAIPIGTKVYKLTSTQSTGNDSRQLVGTTSNAVVQSLQAEYGFTLYIYYNLRRKNATNTSTQDIVSADVRDNDFTFFINVIDSNDSVSHSFCSDPSLVEAKVEGEYKGTFGRELDSNKRIITGFFENDFGGSFTNINEICYDLVDIQILVHIDTENVAINPDGLRRDYVVEELDKLPLELLQPDT